MTDEEVEALQPVVDEFITAVANEDAAKIEFLLREHAPSALAVLVAASGLEQVGRLRDENARLARVSEETRNAARFELSQRASEVARLRESVRELRAWVDAQVAVIAQKDKQIKVLEERQAA